jgi:Arc/MetJ-type ribon-helix-helix transcriptional regulator
VNKEILIPQELYRRLQAHLKNSVFSSMDDLIAFALQDFLDRQNTTGGDTAADADKIIQERLKNLGYL